MFNRKCSNEKSRYILPLVMALLGIVFSFALPISVQAGKELSINEIPEGFVIDEDIFLIGEKPSIEGTVNGDVFVIGSDVMIDGEVNGSIFALAEKINLQGKVSGNLYVAAVEVNQPTQGKIERSLYALSLSLIMEEGSSIDRDLNIVTMSAKLKGKISGKTSAIIGPWEIFKVLRNYFNQNIVGFNPNQIILVEKESEVIPIKAGIPHMASIIEKENKEDSSQFLEYLQGVMKSFINFIVVGGIIFWIFPRQFKGCSQKAQDAPLASAGYGILVLINSYLVPVVSLFLVLGLFISLLWLSLPSLAWTFFGLGFGVLITLFTILQIAITFISKSIIAYLLGSFILSKTAPGVMKYTFLRLLLGLLIYVPIASIPYLGFVVGLVTTLIGLGAIWLERKNFFQQDQKTIGLE